MIGTSITLNDAELMFVLAIANRRCGNNEENNVATKRRNPRKSELQLHIDGFGAELACAKLFNVFPDTEVHCRSSKNDDGDLVLPSGKRIDVKFAAYERGLLLVPTWQQTKVDFYVLITGKSPTYTYRGAISKEELIRKGKIVDLGHGPNYGAEQKELYEIQASESRDVGQR
jgi:hypothetical protein